MCSTENGVKGNHREHRFTSPVKVRLHSPHSSDRIRLVAYVREPVNEGTRVYSAAELHRKENTDTSHIQTTESRLIRVIAYEDAVISCSTAIPARCCTNALMVHSANARQVTWCIKNSVRREEKTNSADVIRKQMGRDLISRQWCVGIEDIVKVAAGEFRKPRMTDMYGERFNVLRNLTN